MSDIITIPAIYEGSRDLKDRSKKLTFGTSEVTPEQASSLQSCVQQYVYLAIKLEDFKKEEVAIINDLKSDYDDFGKTPSQRLQAVLYVKWGQQKEGYEDFNLYYRYKIEQIINHYKSKLI